MQEWLVGGWQPAKINPPGLHFVPKRDKKGEESRKVGYPPSLLSWLLPSKRKKAQTAYGQGEETWRWAWGGLWGTNVTGIVPRGCEGCLCQGTDPETNFRGHVEKEAFLLTHEIPCRINRC